MSVCCEVEFCGLVEAQVRQQRQWLVSLHSLSSQCDHLDAQAACTMVDLKHPPTLIQACRCH